MHSFFASYLYEPYASQGGELLPGRTTFTAQGQDPTEQELTALEERLRFERSAYKVTVMYYIPLHNGPRDC